MLDIKKLREDFEGIRERVEYRGKGDFGINNIKKFDEERRSILAEVEAMKHRQNTVSREIPKLKKAGEDTSEIMAEMKTLSGKIKELSGKLSEIEENLKDALLNVPNTPAEAFHSEKTMKIMWKFVNLENLQSFSLNPRRTGTSVKIWIFLIFREPQKLPVPDLLFTGA